MNDILDDLSVKTLPEIEGYNGSYVNEDWVLQTFQDAAAEIKYLRALNDKTARCLSVAYAGLGTIALPNYAGDMRAHATDTMRRMAEIVDSDQ